jgi:hypothetical protein
VSSSQWASLSPRSGPATTSEKWQPLQGNYIPRGAPTQDGCLLGGCLSRNRRNDCGSGEARAHQPAGAVCLGAVRRDRPPLSPDDPRHGTTNGYGNLGCRCDACREAARVSHAAYMTRVRAEGRIVGGHGTTTAYDTGCRCNRCREAHNAKSRAFKAKRRASKRSETT